MFCSFTEETNPKKKNLTIRSMKLHILKAFIVRFGGRSKGLQGPVCPGPPLGGMQGDDKLAAKG